MGARVNPAERPRVSTEDPSVDSGAVRSAPQVGSGDTDAIARARPRLEAEPSRTTGDALRVSESEGVTRPAGSLDPAALLGSVREGVIDLRVNLHAGNVGMASIRPGTVAVGRVAVIREDGNPKVDFSTTRILFEDEDGRPTDLDGPLWLDAESLYIDSEGRVRAEVPCWPDPDITQEVAGVDRLPDDPVAFANTFLSHAQQHGGSTPTPDTSSGPSTTDGTRSAGDLFDRSTARFSFGGTVQGGMLPLGARNFVQLAEGAELEVHGALNGEGMRIRGNIERAQVALPGGQLQTGPGFVDIGADLEGTRRALDLYDADLTGIRIQRRTAEGRSLNIEVEKLTVSGGGAPAFTAAMEDGEVNLHMSPALRRALNPLPEEKKSEAPTSAEGSSTEGSPAPSRSPADVFGALEGTWGTLRVRELRLTPDETPVLQASGELHAPLEIDREFGGNRITAAEPSSIKFNNVTFSPGSRFPNGSVEIRVPLHAAKLPEPPDGEENALQRFARRLKRVDMPERTTIVLRVGVSDDQLVPGETTVSFVDNNGEPVVLDGAINVERIVLTDDGKLWFEHEGNRIEATRMLFKRDAIPLDVEELAAVFAEQFGE